MKHPFEDSVTFFFEVDNLGEGSIEMVLKDGRTIEADRIDLLLIDHIPFFVAQLAIKHDGEEMFYPKHLIHTDAVISVDNPIDVDVEYLGIGE